MKTSLLLIAAILSGLAACDLARVTRCDDRDWDPTALTCEGVERAASVRLQVISDITAVEILGPEGCPPGGRGCALNNDVALVVVTTATGRELSFLVTIENGRATAGPIQQSAPIR
jgi:hypothetical protein